jgi:acyl carrier protein
MRLDSLKEIVADLFDLDVSEIQKDTVFSSQAFYDSLKVVLLMAALEEDFGLTVSPDIAAELNSIQDIMDYAKTKDCFFEE